MLLDTLNKGRAKTAIGEPDVNIRVDKDLNKSNKIDF